MTRTHMVCLVLLSFAAGLALAQDNEQRPMRWFEYLEAVKEKYLIPNGIDYDALPKEQQARFFGYALSIELMAARFDDERVEEQQRMLSLFQTRYGYHKSEGYKQFNYAYMGMYDKEMQQLTGIPPRPSETILFAERKEEDQ